MRTQDCCGFLICVAIILIRLMPVKAQKILSFSVMGLNTYPRLTFVDNAVEFYLSNLTVMKVYKMSKHINKTIYKLNVSCFW